MHMHVCHKSDPPWEPRGCVLLQWEPFFDVPHITPSNHAFGVCHPNLWAAQERHRRSPAHFLGKFFTNFFFFLGWLNESATSKKQFFSKNIWEEMLITCSATEGSMVWIDEFIGPWEDFCVSSWQREVQGQRKSLYLSHVKDQCHWDEKDGRQSESGTVVVFWSVF